MMRIYYLLILFTLCYRLPSTWAADSAFPDENIHINADRMNQSMTDGVYTAEGNVVVLWKGMNLAADKIRYEEATHMLYATGSVVMTKESNILKGDTLTLDLDTDRAEMDSARLTSPETGMNISAEKLIRINESEYKATSTEMTTCDIPDPSWKFGADKLNVNLLGYATGRNVIFYVKDLPVLYLPWIAFPVVLEKRSGLLFPQIGYSKSRGMQLDLPFYWVISPSQDLQFDLDLLSKRGIGTGIDYRYIRKRGSEGRISAYSIYDQLDNRWRWQLNQEHKEIFSREANLRMAVNANSDRSFLSDFGAKSGEYNRQSSETVVNVLKTWQNYAVNSYLRYSEDLYATDNRSTLQTLPAISMSGVRQQFFSLPLYFDVDATAENLYRKTGTTGQRLHVFPRLTLLPDTGNYLNVSLFTGAHVRGYTTDRRDSSGGIQASGGDVLPEAGLRLSTSLTRIYDTNHQLLKKIRHEIVPEISYNFVPERDQKRLPLYDYVDRFIHRNMISLSVTSLINGKFFPGDTAEYRDISRIKLSADYAIEGGRRDLLTLVESQRSWSDLTLESDTWLTKLLRLTFDSRYNLYEKNLSTAVVGVEANDRQGNLIGAGYQMSRNKVEYFEGRISTRMIKPLNLSYTGRYSFDRGDFLESVYAAEYRHKCWSVNLAVQQRPGNQSYTVNFNLAGLGSK
ncbi:MAG: LPS-assembly protein LptD [Geobacteraceae bacterium]|nr:LPS-assembly protein LptD [Geobacteraceae bacterium]NTW80119.1 LPS-assembly protein LptD [Geobacteraceae bacterium]